METHSQNKLQEQHKDLIRQLNKPNIPNAKEIIEKYDIYQVDETGKTILHLSAMENYKELILYIFESFNDKAKKAEFINIKDAKGWSAIYYAIDISENGFPDIVELLLKHGADPNQADDKGITALHLSAYKGQDDNVEILLKYKADPNKKDIVGRVALNYGIMEGQTNSVQALLDNNTDLSTKDTNGDSLLHYATIGKGNGLLYVIMLCDRGIKVNEVNKDGDTCLNLCIKNGAKENVRIIQKLLFDFKADPNIFNNDEENFYSLMAKEAQREKVNLEESNLTEELKNLFLDSKTNTNNKNNSSEFEVQNLSEKYQVEKPSSQYSNYIFYYFICVVIVIISNLVMKYK